MSDSEDQTLDEKFGEFLEQMIDKITPAFRTNTANASNDEKWRFFKIVMNAFMQWLEDNQALLSLEDKKAMLHRFFGKDISQYEDLLSPDADKKFIAALKARLRATRRFDAENLGIMLLVKQKEQVIARFFNEEEQEQLKFLLEPKEDYHFVSVLSDKMLASKKLSDEIAARELEAGAADRARFSEDVDAVSAAFFMRPVGLPQLTSTIALRPASAPRFAAQGSAIYPMHERIAMRAAELFMEKINKALEDSMSSQASPDSQKSHLSRNAKLSVWKKEFDDCLLAAAVENNVSGNNDGFVLIATMAADALNSDKGFKTMAYAAHEAMQGANKKTSAFKGIFSKNTNNSEWNPRNIQQNVANIFGALKKETPAKASAVNPNVSYESALQAAANRFVQAEVDRHHNDSTADEEHRAPNIRR